MKSLKLVIPILLFAVGCTNHSSSIFTELNDDENVAFTTGMSDYESQWFQYPDSNLRDLHNLVVVKYYVNGDTLFSSEKYHFMSLGYSWDADTTMAYMHMIFFDRKQNPDSNGWYRIVIDKENIPREPGTHISSIALRSYFGEKYPDYKHRPHADAMLFNATKEVGVGRDRNVLSPQLSKLYETIK